MSSPSIDYASAFGIHSVAAAAIFAVLFFPLSFWFVRQSIKNTTYVYIILTLFCLSMFFQWFLIVETYCALSFSQCV